MPRHLGHYKMYIIMSFYAFHCLKVSLHIVLLVVIPFVFETIMNNRQGKTKLRKTTK